MDLLKEARALPKRVVILLVIEILEAVIAALKVVVNMSGKVENPGPVPADALSFDGRVLRWQGREYEASSGPHGKGELPDGEYEVGVRNAAEGESLGPAFTAGGVAFWIPISPLFETDRGHLGIHPDGGVPGTKGCIGLKETDAERFWIQWIKAPIEKRPTRLFVRIG